MKNNSSQSACPPELHALFSTLQPEDVEQFYLAYQLWTLQQREVEIQKSIAAVRQEIVKNCEQLELLRPSPLAQATLARLQSNGVTDVDLLDRMLERGDTWLDHMMQQLEYCEKIGLIRETYTQWCEHALEGAYDWIDTMQVHEAELENEEGELAPATEVEGDQTVKELLLQKLMSEDGEEQEKEDLDATVKIPIITHASGGVPVTEAPSLEEESILLLPTESELDGDELQKDADIADPDAFSLPAVSLPTPEEIGQEEQQEANLQTDIPAPEPAATSSEQQAATEEDTELVEQQAEENEIPPITEEVSAIDTQLIPVTPIPQADYTEADQAFTPVEDEEIPERATQETLIVSSPVEDEVGDKAEEDTLRPEAGEELPENVARPQEILEATEVAMPAETEEVVGQENIHQPDSMEAPGTYTSGENVGEQEPTNIKEEVPSLTPENTQISEADNKPSQTIQEPTIETGGEQQTSTSSTSTETTPWQWTPPPSAEQPQIQHQPGPRKRGFLHWLLSLIFRH